MAILPILYYPDKKLHRKAELVTSIDSSIIKLIDDMTETMYHYNGIGLAATQVNVLKNIFIMDLSRNDEPKNKMVFINAEIIEKNGEEVLSEEGCLSVPNIYETVPRIDVIKIKYMGLDGKLHELECKELMSICVQHEIDHLNGKVFIDYLSQLKQTFIKKKIKNLINKY